MIPECKRAGRSSEQLEHGDASLEVARQGVRRGHRKHTKCSKLTGGQTGCQKRIKAAPQGAMISKDVL